ncbi:ABC transporter substrate-binding protein [Bauldia sp.]|uniref:ABC transporter substrate-binding protein n=1 Tax=Bauldia sp. TaxID=2575872 RepID=UPI003BABE8AF
MRKLGLALAAAVFAAPAFAADVTVGVTAIVEHPALDAARDGVKDSLAAEGFIDGDTIDFVYQSAQGAPATAAQIARQFVGDGVNIIVPISTPSAQAALAATRDIPIVFTAVTDPLAAELVPSLEAPGGNVTGLSDMSPMAEHVALIKEITPDVETIGVLFNPGEANSVSLVNRLKEVAGPAGLTVVEAAATKSADVQAAARGLVGKVDAMYVPTDNTVVSALEAAISVAEENDIPFYAGDTDSVKRGAIASIGFNYYDVGVQTGKVVARVLNGENPGDIDVTFASGSDLFVNPGAAEKMGVTIPAGVIERANTVVE